MSLLKNLKFAKKTMEAFADSTGLFPEVTTPRRYLWTDAFAVCNFLELYKQTDDNRYLQLASHLIEQVHNVLGQHRSDDERVGWISGLDSNEGERHPTAGGLRIGKRLNERGIDDPYDEHLEWERDGQYYHYSTKWMLALLCMKKVTNDERYYQWAIELAKGIHDKFTYQPTLNSKKQMYWKLSIDLSYPLVPSMGQQDPLDGLLTYSELEALRSAHSPSLQFEIEELSSLCKGTNWFTVDPLGLGSLMTNSYHGSRLLEQGALMEVSILWEMIDASIKGLEALKNQDWAEPARLRLAFRELGLSIGLKAGRKLIMLSRSISTLHDVFGQQMNKLEQLIVDFGEIEKYWLNAENRSNETWKEHQDINSVMLVTALFPNSFLNSLSASFNQGKFYRSNRILR